MFKGQIPVALNIDNYPLNIYKIKLKAYHLSTIYSHRYILMLNVSI